MTNDAKVIERSGCQIHYWIDGPSSDHVLVLNHGATLDHRLFDPQRSVLADQFRVISWDLPGHGISKPMPKKFSLSSAVGDLQAILKRERVRRVTLVGQSMGGDICQEYSFRFPQQVQRMILIGCAPVIRPSTRMNSFFTALSVWKLRLIPLDRFRHQVVSESAVLPTARDYGMECLEQLSRRELIAIWKAIGSSAHDEPDYCLPCPTLMLVGEEDHVGGGWVRNAAIQWGRREPMAQLCKIPNAGHMANLDAPDIVNKSILEFLRAG